MHKIHWLFLGTAIALIASNSHAYSYGIPYVGISVGEVTNTIDDNSASVFRGVPLTINVGYGNMLSLTTYLGGEIFGVIPAARFNQSSLDYRYAYGVSVIPGVMLADHTMGFMRLGLVRLAFNAAVLGNDVPVACNGVQVGLGLQFSVTPAIDLRSEYIYTRYTYNAIGRKQDAVNFGIIYKLD